MCQSGVNMLTGLNRLIDTLPAPRDLCLCQWLHCLSHETCVSASGYTACPMRLVSLPVVTLLLQETCVSASGYTACPMRLVSLPVVTLPAPRDLCLCQWLHCLLQETCVSASGYTACPMRLVSLPVVTLPAP